MTSMCCQPLVLHSVQWAFEWEELVAPWSGSPDGSRAWGRGQHNASVACAGVDSIDPHVCGGLVHQQRQRLAEWTDPQPQPQSGCRQAVPLLPDGLCVSCKGQPATKVINLRRTVMLAADCSMGVASSQT